MGRGALIETRQVEERTFAKEELLSQRVDEAEVLAGGVLVAKYKTVSMGRARPHQLHSYK